MYVCIYINIFYYYLYIYIIYLYIYKIMEYIRLGGTLKLISFQPPAMGRESFHVDELAQGMRQPQQDEKVNS